MVGHHRRVNCCRNANTDTAAGRVSTATGESNIDLSSFDDVLTGQNVSVTQIQILTVTGDPGNGIGSIICRN